MASDTQEQRASAALVVRQHLRKDGVNPARRTKRPSRRLEPIHATGRFTAACVRSLQARGLGHPRTGERHCFLYRYPVADGDSVVNVIVPCQMDGANHEEYGTNALRG